MFISRFMSLLLVLTVGSIQALRPRCFQCVGGPDSPCAKGYTTGMATDLCATDTCVTSTSSAANKILRGCSTGSKIVSDCIIKLFKGGCIDITSSAITDHAGLMQCVENNGGSGQGRSFLNSIESDIWCFCTSDKCNSGRNLGNSGQPGGNSGNTGGRPGHSGGRPGHSGGSPDHSGNSGGNSSHSEENLTHSGGNVRLNLGLWFGIATLLVLALA